MATKKHPEGIFWKALQEKAQQVICNALEACDGNVTRTALVLGIDRTYLTSLMSKLDISRADNRAAEKPDKTDPEDGCEPLNLSVELKPLAGGGCVVKYCWPTEDGGESLEAAFSTMRRSKSDAANFILGTGDWQE